MSAQPTARKQYSTRTKPLPETLQTAAKTLPKPEHRLATDALEALHNELVNRYTDIRGFSEPVNTGIVTETHLLTHRDWNALINKAGLTPAEERVAQEALHNLFAEQMNEHNYSRTLATNYPVTIDTRRVSLADRAEVMA